MTDRELLELAAKAVGIEHVTPSMVEWGLWNPLTDDGDALRLAVNLKIQITPEYVFQGPWEGGGFLRDPYAATRRAIVRAAAEIGKAMK